MNFLRVTLATVLCLVMTSHTWGATLSLQECLQKAKDNNPALKAAAWENRIALDNRRLTTAANYPRLDASAGYTMLLDPQAVRMNGVTAETQEADFAFAAIAASYTLYDFGRRDAKIRQSDAYSESISHSYLHSKGGISLQVIETYFRILETEQLIQAASEEVTQINEHKRIARVMLEEGVVTRNDVLQADVRLASAEQKLLTATSSRDNAWMLLNFLTGNAPEFRGELERPSIEDNLLPHDKTTAKRHDIEAQKLILEAREFEVQENRSSYFPEFYTRLAIDYMQNDKVREQAVYSATLGLKVNLFDGYATSAARDKAVKQRSQQQDALRLTELRADLEITTARSDAAVAFKRINVAEKAIKQSEENLRINKERYQERVGIASEVLDAQTLATQAKADFFRAVYDYQTASARLRNALGEL